MKITWLGHACFLLEQDGYRVVTDPYTRVPGYPPLEVEANALYCSHEHFDHAYREGVTLVPGGENPFAVEEIPAYHDDEHGAKRGEIVIRVFSAGGVRVCHVGDLGHQLSSEQTAAIGRCDVLLIPVGGTYTVDAAGAKAVCDTLRPRCVVPMHYRHAPYGLEAVGGLEDFLRLWPDGDIERLTESSFIVTDSMKPVVVPVYPA